MAHPLRAKLPKLGALLYGAADAVLTTMKIPKAHWPQSHSNQSLERLNAETQHKTHAVRILPDDAAMTRWVGEMRPEQHDAWSPKRW